MKNFRLIAAFLFVFGLGAFATFLYMSHYNDGHGYERMHNKHHKPSQENDDHHGQTHQHDEVKMPGLEGKDTTDLEVDDLKTIFRSHLGIQRKVINLPNGIKTITEAKDITLREAIVSHVTMMVTRLQEGKNPEIKIQSPTLDELFKVYEEIDTGIEMTDFGIAVVQTSSNPAVVDFLQTHASEVSDMAARGMAAVHERMMASGKKLH